MLTQTKVEQIVKSFDLKEVDAKFKGHQIFALDTGKQKLGVVIQSKIVEVIKILPDKFVRVFRSGENKISDVYDMKIVFDLIVDSEESTFINRTYQKNKK